MASRSLRLDENFEELLRQRASRFARKFNRSREIRELCAAGLSTENKPDIADIEQRIAGSLARMQNQISLAIKATHYGIALTDGLAKLLLTLIPEPQGQALDNAKASAVRRYGKFIDSVAAELVKEREK